MTTRTAVSLVSGLFAVTLIATSPIAAGDKNKGGKHGEPGVEARVTVDVFVGRDRELIRGYFSRNHGNLPPGLAKRGGNLPPGLQKQLARKGHLPPGLEKKIAPFPVELESRLSPLKPGLRRGVIEGHAVIYGEKSSSIFDALVIF